MKTPQELIEKEFDNPPLREVAFELRFAPLLKVQRDLADFQDLIVEDYPTYGTEKISVNGEKLHSWRFTSEDQSRTVRVTERSFGFITNRYQSFETYKSELLKRLESFHEIFKITSFHRMGLRYINNIPLNSERPQASLLEYVNPVLDLKRFQADKISQFACEIRLSKESGQLTIRTGLIGIGAKADGDIRSEPIYILDLDFYQEGVSRNSITALLDTFHGEIQIEFLTQVREVYIGVMQKKKT